MSDKQTSEPAGDDDAVLSETIRPATRRLCEAIWLDAWPHASVIVDFGIDSQEHYEALYYPIREGEQLTALVRAAPSNPHPDIEFSTSWDVVLGRTGLLGGDSEPEPFTAESEHAERANQVQTRFDAWKQEFEARSPLFADRETWQVWHLAGPAEGRIVQMLGGPEPVFPDEFVHVADVPAGSPEEVVRLTTDKGDVFDGTCEPWDCNPDVLARHFAPRDTDAGDVLIDPAGQAYRIERDGFRTLDLKPPPPTPGALAEQSNTAQPAPDGAPDRSRTR